MNEEFRIRFMKRYQAICRKRGWITDSGEDVWPPTSEERAMIAREMFGLALISDTDGSFYHVKEQIGAEAISATPTLKAALETIGAMNDEQKSAILSLTDDILDFAVYKFSILLDRFDHGFLSLRFQAKDNETCEPMPETEVEINPCGFNEMFQDALRWKEEYSMGAEIGRPCDPREKEVRDDR